jgi:putative PepSY-like beta-lactamase-inhibitor
MRKIAIRSGVSVLAAFALLTTPGCARNNGQHQRLSPSSVPAQVRDSMEARFPGAQVRSVEREKEGGNIVYDYELTQNGRKYEMDIKEDGTVLEVEKQLTGRDIPDSVTRAVQARYPNAAIKEVMEVDKVSGRQETPDHYEVTLSGAGAKGKEVEVSLDGRVTEEGAGEK